MNYLKVTYKDFELSTLGSKRRERIKIVSKYPDTPLAKIVFSNLGLMHLISPHFPKKISIDFGIFPQIKELIKAMYKSANLRPSSFQASEIRTNFSSPRINPKKVAIAYSGGKDSLWNLWWTQEKYGFKNILVVHINGLNRTNAPWELKYSKRQQKKIGFSHFRIIDLINSSRNNGFNNMHSRDMFLIGIIIPLAIEFGASKIITEGFAETDPEEAFTGREENMYYFNNILKKIGIPIQAAWRNRREMDVVKDLLIHRPNWLPHVCSCFSSPNHQLLLRRAWQQRAPTFPLYDSQCGSCVKCRVINLARVLYDPTIEKIKENDVRVFLKDTAKWIQIKKRGRIDEFIGESFKEYFKKAVEKYGLNGLKSIVS